MLGGFCTPNNRSQSTAETGRVVRRHNHKKLHSIRFNLQSWEKACASFSLFLKHTKYIYLYYLTPEKRLITTER